MKITMYELYGKIYDENPPKHIRVYGDDWYWNNYDGYVTKESLKTTPDAQIYLMDRYRTFMNLDKEVEVIEKEKKDNFTGWKMYQDGKEVCSMDCSVEEKKIPEKLEIYKDRNNTIFLDDLCYKYMPIHKDSLSFNEQVIVDKLNEILDYLKSKGE